MPAPSHRDSRIRRIRGNQTTVADPLQIFEDMRRLTEENHNLLQRLNAADLEIERLKEEAKSADQENENLKEELKSADQENENLKEELKSTDEERDWLQYKLDGAEHEIRRLFLECREVRKDLM